MSKDLPDGISLRDPRPDHLESPYTFFLPAHEVVEAIEPGDIVKAIFCDKDGGYDTERMWISVEEVIGENIIGHLDNEPSDMVNLKCGDRVVVPKTHVIDVDVLQSRELPAFPKARQYWDRCLVDDCVLYGRSPVDYLYREEPDMTKEGDKDSDSGWRIRGNEDEIEKDKQADKAIHYVALGAVLNEDDSWLHLIDSAIGKAFQRNAQTGEFDEVRRS